MDYILKIQPYTESTITSGNYTIVGIRGRMGDVPFTLKDKGLSRLFYLEFLDKNLELKSSTNESRDSLLAKFKEQIKLTDKQIEEEDLNSQAEQEVDQLFHDIEGTTEERFTAIQKIIGFYNMIPLPLSEQNGLLTQEELK